MVGGIPYHGIVQQKVYREGRGSQAGASGVALSTRLGYTMFYSDASFQLTAAGSSGLDMAGIKMERAAEGDR